MNLYSTEEIKRYLNYKSRSTIETFRKKGMPFHETPNGGIRFDLDEVNNWLKIYKKSK